MFTPWLQLPIELKAMVLEHAVHDTEPIDYSRHNHNLERKACLGALIGTRNHEVTQLSIEQYYSVNVFVLDLDTGSWPSIRKLQRPRPQHARRIQHLDFLLYCCFPTLNTEIIFFGREFPWTFVFAADGNLKHPGFSFQDMYVIAKRAELWRDFSHLRTFNAKVIVEPCWYQCPCFYYDLMEASRCFYNCRPRIEKVLGHSRLGFKAKKCAVIFDVPDCVRGDCSLWLNAVLGAAVSTGE